MVHTCFISSSSTRPEPGRLDTLHRWAPLLTIPVPVQHRALTNTQIAVSHVLPEAPSRQDHGHLDSLALSFRGDQGLCHLIKDEKMMRARCGRRPDATTSPLVTSF